MKPTEKGRYVIMYIICTDQLIFCSTIHIFISLFGCFFFIQDVCTCVSMESASQLIAVYFSEEVETFAMQSFKVTGHSKI